MESFSKDCYLSLGLNKYGHLRGQGSPPGIFGAVVRAWFMKIHSFFFISVDALSTLLSSILVTILLKVSFLSPYRIILLISQMTPFLAKKYLRFVVIIKILNGPFKVAITRSYVGVLTN